MDGNVLGLLVAVNTLCEGTSWRIFDEADLSELLPAGQAENISAALEQLEARRLIDLRYAEGGTYCVRVLPAGRAYAARRQEEQAAAAYREHRIFRTAFWGGLAGAFVGAILALLFSLLW